MSGDAERFDDPKRVAIGRVYTRRGDGGETSLVGGQRVSKASLRLEVYGVVDELNAFVGAAAVTLAGLDTAAAVSLAGLAAALVRVQHQLFNLGSILATLPDDVSPNQPRTTAADVAWLESEMDAANAALPALRSFVLPGGTRLSTDLHLCRTVCRRAERLAVALAAEEAVDADILAFLNRLGDAFFVWSRHVNRMLGVPEVLWRPNAARGEP